MIEELAAQLARAIDATSSPERAMNNLDRFIQGVGGRRFYYELLLDRPELAPRLAALFSDSEYLSSYLATHPRLIEPIFSDPNVLLLSRPELRENLAEIRRDLAREDAPRRRRARPRRPAAFPQPAAGQRRPARSGRQDLALRGGARPDRGRRGVRGGSARGGARRDGAARGRSSRPGAGGEFLVVAMGKLASRELTYGSDLDVIFLYDVARGRRRGAGRGAGVLRAPCAEAHLGVADANRGRGVLPDRRPPAPLRQSGHAGQLARVVRAVPRQHGPGVGATGAPAGAPSRQRRAPGERLRGIAAAHPAAPGASGPGPSRSTASACAWRASWRRKRHGAATSRPGAAACSTSRASFSSCSCATARSTRSYSPSTTWPPTWRGCGLSTSCRREHARVLLQGWQFLQLLSSRLRIVENRSISDLDEERGDLDTLAHRLGYASPQRAGGARRSLLEDYRHHTGAIRGVYLEVLGVELS